MTTRLKKMQHKNLLFPTAESWCSYIFASIFLTHGIQPIVLQSAVLKLIWLLETNNYDLKERKRQTDTLYKATDLFTKSPWQDNLQKKVETIFWSNFFHKQTLFVPRKVLSSMGLFFCKKTLVFLVTIFFWSNFFLEQTLFVPRKVLSSMGLFFCKKLWSS